MSLKFYHKLTSMNKYIFTLLAFPLLFSCNSNNQKQTPDNNKELAKIMADYYNERMNLFPIEATWNGDTSHNDKFYADFTDSYRTKIKDFYTNTLNDLHKVKREDLNENDKISYDFLEYYNSILIHEFDYKFNLIPTDQMWGVHLVMGQFASGTSAQPFKTVKDYDNWLKRIDAFDIWIDSAIVYFKKGAAENFVLPKSLVIKMIPQFEAMVTSDPKENLYYGPLNNFPANFSDSEKNLITSKYVKAINEKVVPMNLKMATFLKAEYLPKARLTSGYSSLPGGLEYYKLKVRLNTTTREDTG